MKKYFLILFLSLSHVVFAQQIINAVLVGDKGITEDVKKAKSLIVVKSYGDTAIQRLEYNVTGPLKSRLTYRDRTMEVLHGNYATFFKTGITSTQGNYVDNRKDGKWYVYNEKAKAVTEYNYHLDTLLSVLNWDSLELAKKKIITDTTGEQEASYKDGEKKFQEYIYANLKIPDRTQALEAGGTVKVRFMINTSGKVVNVYIWRSVEFAFDEEVIRLVSSAGDWIPAVQRGRKVNAYREQPVSISFR